MPRRVAQTGDTILFRTPVLLAGLQRVATRSRWDHVGLLVHRDRAGRVCTARDSHSVRVAMDP